MSRIEAEQMIKLVDRVNEWLESFDNLQDTPRCSWTYAGVVEMISIGDICIWDDQDGYLDESLNDSDQRNDPQYDWIVHCWRHYIHNLAIYVN